MNDNASKVLAVYAVRKRGIWTRAGTGRLNADGSIAVTLDVLPIDGQLFLQPPGKAPADFAGGTVYLELGRDGVRRVKLERAGAQPETLKSFDPASSRSGPAASIDVAYTFLVNFAHERGAAIAADWDRSEP